NAKERKKRPRQLRSPPIAKSRLSYDSVVLAGRRSLRFFRNAMIGLLTGVNFASPKSRILACPRLVMQMLAGLMSRWTIPSCDCSGQQALRRAGAMQRVTKGSWPSDSRGPKGHAAPLPFAEITQFMRNLGRRKIFVCGHA